MVVEYLIFQMGLVSILLTPFCMRYSEVEVSDKPPCILANAKLLPLVTIQLVI